MNGSTNELKSLKDFELNSRIKNLALQERKILQGVLECIAEVDRRKLHLRLAYPSLFEYLIREIGYSAGAARLLQKVPEISNKIESGSINLSQISKMQKLCRQIKKDSGQPISTSQQRDILKKLEHQGTTQTDLILAKEFQVKIVAAERQSIQQDESVRIEITFSKEEMSLIRKAQELLSHKAGGKLKETLLEMAQKTVKAAEPKVADPMHEQKAKVVTQAAQVQTTTATVAVKEFSSKVATYQPVNPKTVTLRLKKEISQRDQCCQFTDRRTGQACGSKLFLEVDHVQPRFAQGDNSTGNLRLLCKNHNRFRYQAGL